MHQVSEIDAPTQRSGNLLDLFLKYVSEIPATLILVVEIIVLLAGVTARYVFAAPLEWTEGGTASQR